MRRLAGLALLQGLALLPALALLPGLAGMAQAAPKFMPAPPPPEAKAEAEAQAEPNSLGGMVESALASIHLTPELAGWAALGVLVLGLLIFGRARRPKPDPRLAGDAALRAEFAAANAALARLDPSAAQRRPRTGNGGPGAERYSDDDGGGDGGGGSD